MSADLKMLAKKNKDTDSEKSLNLSRLSRITDQYKRDFKTDKEWLDYCDWLDRLSKEAMDHFVRGVQIGVELQEGWLVCRGGAYAWNYMHHIFENKYYSKVVGILNTLLEGFKKTGHNW